MAVDLRVAGWKAAGFRCPDHEVSFLCESDEVHKITLLQMPNGTGKTTTLDLLRAALSGSADEWSPDKVRSYQKKTADSHGTFQITLLVNGRRLTIAMEFEFEDGTVHYTTTIPSGMKDGFHPPRELMGFLREDFVDFFVFDGELAEHLLDRDHTDAQRVIEDLFQLRLFFEISQRVQEYWERKTADCGATETKGLSRRRNLVETLRTCLATRRSEVAAIRTDIRSTKDELLKKKNKYNTALAEHRELSERLRKAEQELTKAEGDVKKCAHDVLVRMQEPHALSAVFAREMLTFKLSLDKVKLPESTAREFFEELAEEDTCVCGRELDDASRKTIRDQASRYLGTEDVALLNSIKADVADLVGSDVDVHEREFTTLVDQLKDHCRREGELRTKRDSIEIDGLADDPELEQVKKDINELEAKVRGLGEELRQYEDSSDSAQRSEDVRSIRVLERRLEDAEEKLSEITNTLSLKKKRDILTSVLTSGREMAQRGISEEVCADANGRIEELMPYNGIRIDAVDRCLVLRGQEGGSAGETLTVAYAFLATLFNRAEHCLPFVVDSPANPIDLEIRAKVAELVPRLTPQFVAFTISSERQGFLDPLEKACEGPIQYLTLFRKGPEDLEEAARKTDSFNESSDGFCVHGRPFFREFHLETENRESAV